MLFIDDDQAQLGQGGEHCQTGAEHDACAALKGGAPVAGAGGFSEFAVQAGQLCLRKASGDAAFELRREVDFRHQQQRLLAGGEGAFDEAQVDLGFAAAGDAVQQPGAKAAASIDACQRGLLLCGEWWRALGVLRAGVAA